MIFVPQNQLDTHRANRLHKVNLVETVFYTISGRFQKICHAPQADAHGGEVMQHGGGGGREDAQSTQGNQRTVESNDKPVIGANALGQSEGDPPQADQFKQIVRSDGDISDLSGDSRTVTDSNAHVSFGQRRGIVDAVRSSDLNGGKKKSNETLIEI